MALILVDEHQKILNETGHLLVTGGPGSGKTTIAIQKAFKFINEGLLKNGQKVLFLSFSRAAVARISETADLTGKRSDTHQFLVIQTFHSFFWEIIKTHGYLLAIPKNLKVLSPHDEDSFRQGRKETDPNWLAERRKYMLDEGRICFDLFAETALTILTKSKRVLQLFKQKFPLIIIDEAQDTDSIQWATIKQFSENCKIVFLADLDQQIHDYREDVTPERINEIIHDLQPTKIDLGKLNHRSNGTEITQFARDMLNNSPRFRGYNGVTELKYNPRANFRDRTIRQSLGILNQHILKAKGSKAENIAMLATWGKGVRIISNALRGNEQIKEITHRVQFDETSTYLSSRIIAFLLEPKSSNLLLSHIADVLKLMSDHCRAKGQQSEWEKIDKWIEILKSGVLPKRSTVISEIKRIIEKLVTSRFSGVPEKDWIDVKNLLLTSTNFAIKEIGRKSEYLMAFNQGRMISRGLTIKWQETGSYIDAQNVLDGAIVETQIISENKNQNGINVMTVHKAKGKEFDGVIIFDNFHSSPLVARVDTPNLHKSRKLLLVAITRAKYHVLILRDSTQTCPILENFTL